MDALLYSKVLKLKEAIEKDERIILLNQIEKEMEECDEVMKLSYKKDMACIAFNDALKHFSNDSKEVKDAQHDLYVAKLNLDNHPLIQKYNSLYKEVKKIYSLINKELFGPFIKEQGDLND